MVIQQQLLLQHLAPNHGTIFILSSLLLQNLVFLPAIFMLSNSGIKLYRNLRQNKYVNMKIEFVRHLLFMLLVLALAIVSSFIEVYLSTNFLYFFKDFL